MRFTAITQDQILMVDGEAVTPPHVSFEMPRGEWAVHFDTSTGLGEVEYLDSRQNETINQIVFDERYGYLVTVHTESLLKMEAALEAALVEPVV